MTRPIRARRLARLGAVCLTLAIGLLASAPAQAQWRLVERQTLSGLDHPESVAWDPAGGVWYLSNFGPVFENAKKDGQGYISRLDAQGRVLEKRALPKQGAMDKPKGLWLAQGRLWATDIDGVWVFDLASGQGRRVEVPGARFLNDPVEAGGKLYVSDTAGDRVYQVEPADFLAREPRVSVRLEQKGLAPNGLWMRTDGALVIAGSPRDGDKGRLWRLDPGAAQARPLTPPLGTLDGLAVLDDDSIVFTDWASHGIYILEPQDEPRLLLQGFGGPADFGLAPQGGGYVLALPDLVRGQLHIYHLVP